MSASRSPVDDPRSGDCIQRPGSEKPVLRFVVRRDGNTVYYRSTREPGSVVRNCWITTWMDWARGADVTTTAETPVPRARVRGAARH